MAQLTQYVCKLGHYFILIIFFSSCSSTSCRNVKLAEAEEKANKLKSTNAAELETVKVFRYDGTLQCGMGKAIPLEVMAKDLGEIKIFSSERKNDGMMRIQLCGSPTGSANIYLISKSDLDKAKKYGFKEWTFE